MRIERFEDIQAWQVARELSKLVYDVSREDLFSRDLGLQTQIRRAAISVMANIAEGYDCDTDADFCRFLGFARRSASEVQSHCYAALDAQYITSIQFEQVYAKAKDAKGLIGGFTRYLRTNPRKQRFRID